jgi:hypothetical protein
MAGVSINLYRNRVQALYNAVQAVGEDYCLCFFFCKIEIYELIWILVKWPTEKRTVGGILYSFSCMYNMYCIFVYVGLVSNVQDVH